MSIGSPRFTKINESFECRNCGAEVPAASSTCRDHCPFCLFSVHVDVNPGDRAANCGGTLKPVGYSHKSSKGYMIHYVCEKCGMTRTNRFLDKDKIRADDFDVLLQLSGHTEL